jgi:hypothetical protein
MANNSYMSIWLVGVPTTEDDTSQKYRYLWVQGQANTTTLATEQARLSSSLNMGDLTPEYPEYSFLARIILRFTGGNWQWQQADLLSGTKVSQSSSPAGSFLSTVTTDTTLTGDGTLGNPLAVSSLIARASARNTTGSARSETIGAMAVGELKTICFTLENSGGTPQAISLVLPASGTYSGSLCANSVSGQPNTNVLETTTPYHYQLTALGGGATIKTFTVTNGYKLVITGTIHRIS